LGEVTLIRKGADEIAHEDGEMESSMVDQTKAQRSYQQSLEDEFRRLVKEWRNATCHTSSLTKMVTNSSYLRIIGLGEKAIPLVLRELEARPDHWLVALHALTGEDPAPEGSTFTEAVHAWLEWGRERGYLS
jgi:hypothetical protein